MDMETWNTANAAVWLVNAERNDGTIRRQTDSKSLPGSDQQQNKTNTTFPPPCVYRLLFTAAAVVRTTYVVRTCTRCSLKDEHVRRREPRSHDNNAAVCRRAHGWLFGFARSFSGFVASFVAQPTTD